MSGFLFRAIHAMEARHAVKEYEKAQRRDNSDGQAVAYLCAFAGEAAYHYRQAKDEANYLFWRETEERECALAGATPIEQ